MLFFVRLHRGDHRAEASQLQIDERHQTFSDYVRVGGPKADRYWANPAETVLVNLSVVSLPDHSRLTFDPKSLETV